MKIAFCLNYFLPNQVGGIEVYTYALANSLLKMGVKVLVFNPNFNCENNELYEYEGIKVVKFAEPTVPNSLIQKGFKAPKGLNNFKQVLLEEKPDIVHFQEIGGSIGFSLFHFNLTHSLGIPIVTTIHLTGYTCKTNALLFKQQRPCDGKINTKKCTSCIINEKGIKGFANNVLTYLSIICNYFPKISSKFSHKFFTAISVATSIKYQKTRLNNIVNKSSYVVTLSQWYKQVLILNNVDLLKIKVITQALPSITITKKQHTDIKKLKLIYVGRIDPTKGLHLILHALAKLNDSNISLSIYGKETDAMYAKAQKTFSKEMKNVFWKAVLHPSQVTAKIKEHDCLILPSIICEMSPLVIQEAFSVSVPVIASNVQGNVELISHEKNGWLFKRNDIEDLVLVLKNIMNNITVIKNTSHFIKPCKSFDTVAEEYLNLYQVSVQK